MCKIFQKSEPETSYARLRSANKKWLLRESRVSGMITLDWLDKHKGGCSRRFAHTDKGWVGGVGTDLPHDYVSLRNIKTHAKALFELLAADGFVDNDCLVPLPAQRTVFDAYSAYASQSLSFFERHEDPVSLEEIPKEELFVGPTGAFFSRETVQKILAQDKPHDPLTNLPIGPHDFRPVGHIAQRLEGQQNVANSAASSSSVSVEQASAAAASPSSSSS